MLSHPHKCKPEAEECQTSRQSRDRAGGLIPRKHTTLMYDSHQIIFNSQTWIIFTLMNIISARKHKIWRVE
jgi:hypothetical protein